MFLVVLFVGIIFWGARGVLSALLAVFFHEAGHALMARTRGYVATSLVLLPYGAKMSVDESIDQNSSVLIGLAGPIANLFFALVTVGLWWVCPTAYPYTKPFLHANLSLAFFNLLPAYPLDGGRVLVGLSKNKLKILKVLRIFGVVLSIIFLALFVVSCFFGINFSLLVTAIFLFYGALSEEAERCYAPVFSPLSKDYDLGVEKKHILVSKDMPIHRLLRFSGQNHLVTFEIVESGFVFDESQLQDVALKNPLSTEIGKVLG